MTTPARGEDPAIDRAMARDRKNGWTWNNTRVGIVAKTPQMNGKHATSIWYGEHVVTWKIYQTRPKETSNGNG